MWEILADVAVLAGDAPVRVLRARRARRRFAAGRQTRIPCSVRSDRPGWPTVFTSGSLLLTPGSPDGAFGSRAYPYLLLPVGGTFHDPEPDPRNHPDWAATTYQPPGGGPAVHLQAHTRYLPTVRLALQKI